MRKRKKDYILLSIVIISVLFITATSFSTSVTTPKFSDVNDTDWFFSDVEYVYEKKLMAGTGATTFSPDTSTTRAMLATVLWRMEKSPEGNAAMSFRDIAEDAYYRDAVLWCMEKQIVFGYSDTLFAPDDFITREQLVTMIYRYASYKDYDITNRKALIGYSDAAEISEYALNQFEWAIANGIISGTGADTLSPKKEAKRCEVAAILKRFLTEFGGVSEAAETAEEDKAEMQTQPLRGNNDSEPAASLSGGATADSSTDAPPTDAGDIEGTYAVISTDNITANAGESVSVAVNIENNPGILGMILSVYYNEDTLLLESIENGEAFSSLDMTPSKNLKSGMRLIWDGIEIKPEDVRDGTILLMNFKVKEDAQKGKYPITLKYTQGDIVDNGLKTVTPAVETGYITVLQGGDIN